MTMLEFVEQLNNFLHTWIDTKPYSCDLCKSSNKLLAAFHCDGCKKNLCRQCFHRSDIIPSHPIRASFTTN